MSDLTDKELPCYALIHCETPVAAFHKKHVVKLLRLAGQNEDADRVERLGKEWWNLGPDVIRPLVEKITTLQAPTP